MHRGLLVEEQPLQADSCRPPASRLSTLTLSWLAWSTDRPLAGPESLTNASQPAVETHSDAAASRSLG